MQSSDKSRLNITKRHQNKFINRHFIAVVYFRLSLLTYIHDITYLQNKQYKTLKYYLVFTVLVPKNPFYFTLKETHVMSTFIIISVICNLLAIHFRKPKRSL